MRKPQRQIIIIEQKQFNKNIKLRYSQKTGAKAQKEIIMAQLILENPNTGIIKTAPVGVSILTFLFPGMPALFRGDFLGCIIQWAVSWLFIPIFIFPFIYNKMYLKKLLEKGYKVKSVDGGNIDSINASLGMNLPMLEEK